MKFIIADNQAIYREGLVRVIAREPEWTIVALCTEPETFQQLLPRFKGAVALFSASLGCEPAAVYERAQEAEARCIAIIENGQHPTPFKAAGVHGIVYRTVAAPVLIRCIRSVVAGERMLQNAKSTEPADEVGERVRDRLRGRKMQIAGLVARGLANREIAAELGLSEQVVKNQLRTIFDCAGVDTRGELGAFVIAHRALALAAEDSLLSIKAGAA